MARIISKQNIRVPRQPVYDLTSPAHSNFGVGVSCCIVHNSKDLADAVTGSIWNAMKNMDTDMALLTPDTYEKVFDGLEGKKSIYDQISSLGGITVLGG